jgi:hypothetical protein
MMPAGRMINWSVLALIGVRGPPLSLGHRIPDRAAETGTS